MLAANHDQRTSVRSTSDSSGDIVEIQVGDSIEVGKDRGAGTDYVSEGKACSHRRSFMAADQPHIGRVLMVAFQFPPAGGSGTQRTLKFARYLPEFGWDVEILTARAAVHEAQDPTLLAEVPQSVPVHHAPCFIPGTELGIRGWYPSFMNFPDRYSNWFPFATRFGRRLLRERRFDVIYATHPTRTAKY